MLAQLRKLLTTKALILCLCSFSSGGEDGYVRVHVFDDDYYKFKLDV